MIQWFPQWKQVWLKSIHKLRVCFMFLHFNCNFDSISRLCLNLRSKKGLFLGVGVRFNNYCLLYSWNWNFFIFLKIWIMTFDCDLIFFIAYGLLGQNGLVCNWGNIQHCFWVYSYSWTTFIFEVLFTLAIRSWLSFGVVLGILG